MTNITRKKKKYREYYRWIPVKMLQEYPELKNKHSIQAQVFVWAIEKASKETEALSDGRLRVRAVEMVYFNKSHNIEGAAQELYSSYATVQRWLSEYVDLVAKYSGYKE